MVKTKPVNPVIPFILIKAKVWAFAFIAFGEDKFSFTLKVCINYIIDEILSSEFKDDFKKKALLYHTLSEFMKSCTLADRETVEFDVYRKAIAYISEHFTENITLETVADSVGVTTPHLSRVLNGGCKSSFSDIINALRIYEAKKLLEQTTLSISEVAYASGYGSIRNFNRIFVKYFRCNPKDIRKK